MTKPESLPEQEECDPATSQTGEKTSQEALDELYLLTAHLVVKNEKASTSWLQRKRCSGATLLDLEAEAEVRGWTTPSLRPHWTPALEWL